MQKILELLFAIEQKSLQYQQLDYNQTEANLPRLAPAVESNFSPSQQKNRKLLYEKIIDKKIMYQTTLIFRDFRPKDKGKKDDSPFPLMKLTTLLPDMHPCTLGSTKTAITHLPSSFTINVSSTQCVGYKNMKPQEFMCRIADVWKIQRENMFKLRDICYDYTKSDLLAALMVSDIGKILHDATNITQDISQPPTFESLKRQGIFHQEEDKVDHIEDKSKYIKKAKIVEPEEDDDDNVEEEEDDEEDQEEKEDRLMFHQQLKNSIIGQQLDRIIKSRHNLYEKLPDIDLAKLLARTNQIIARNSDNRSSQQHDFICNRLLIHLMRITHSSILLRKHSNTQSIIHQSLSFYKKLPHWLKRYFIAQLIHLLNMVYGFSSPKRQTDHFILIDLSGQNMMCGFLGCAFRENFNHTAGRKPFMEAANRIMAHMKQHGQIKW